MTKPIKIGFEKLQQVWDLIEKSEHHGGVRRSMALVYLALLCHPYTTSFKTLGRLSLCTPKTAANALKCLGQSRLVQCSSFKDVIFSGHTMFDGRKAEARR